MEKILLAIIFGLIPLAHSTAGIFGPSTYEDCVLEGIKTAKTKEAVSSVHAMCRRKFNVPSDATPVPPPRITSDCRVAYDGRRMYPTKSKPVGYKSRKLTRDGIDIATVYVPEEMNTKSNNWAERMFIMALEYCDLSLF